MTNHSKVSGILSIVSGALGVLGAILFFGLTAMVPVIVQSAGGSFPVGTADALVMIYVSIGVVNLILGVVAIVGGVFAIKKKYWGLGLTAAILSILIFLPTGIPALVYIIKGRKEFTQGSASSAQPVQ